MVLGFSFCPQAQHIDFYVMCSNECSSSVWAFSHRMLVSLASILIPPNNILVTVMFAASNALMANEGETPLNSKTMCGKTGKEALPKLNIDFIMILETLSFLLNYHFSFPKSEEMKFHISSFAEARYAFEAILQYFSKVPCKFARKRRTVN